MDMSQSESNSISNILSYGCKILLRQEANTVGLTLRLVDEQQLTIYQRQTYRTAQGRLHSGAVTRKIFSARLSFCVKLGTSLRHQYLVLQNPMNLTRTKLI